MNGGEAQVLTAVAARGRGAVCGPGKVRPRAAGVGAAVSLSFSCKRENPLQISCNCQKQVLNVGYFLSILFFFLNYILGCTRSQLWHGGFSGGMPTPSCDRGNPVPQPGSCIGSVEAQPLDRQGSSI